ncbi:MAG: hypothetical protein ABJH08_03780 [Balneola sp.]
MEPFEFKIDTSTFYIKTLNALGFIFLGFAFSAILSAYKHGEPIDWMNTSTSLVLSLVLAFFPGRAKIPSFTINDQGIFLKNYGLQDAESSKIHWDKISSIRVERKQLSIKKTIGSYESVRFPIFTKNQVEDLKTYLKEITAQKEVEYLG